MKPFKSDMTPSWVTPVVTWQQRDCWAALHLLVMLPGGRTLNINIGRLQRFDTPVKLTDVVLKTSAALLGRHL